MHTSFPRFLGSVVRTLTLLAVVASLLGLLSDVYAQEVPSWAQGNKAQKAGGPAFGNLGSDLAQLYRQHQRFRTSKSTGATFEPALSMLPVQDEMVTVDVLAQNGKGARLMRRLQALGGEGLARRGRLISGQLPISALGEVKDLNALHSAEPAWMMSADGQVITQGDSSMKADIAREGGPDGSGVQVGVISDSYNQSGNAISAQDDIDSGDLPGPDSISVLEDPGPGSDEGRAMMQIIHDVAPAAKLAFHTAFGGQANFAQGVRDLADAGSGVITDDIIYFAEPMFQDGVIADAVEDVTQNGVAYFSAVGNNYRQSHRDTFTVANIGFLGPNGGTLHDFGGGDIFQQVTIPEGTVVSFSFQWTDPYASVSSSGTGADTDLNLYLIAKDSSLVAASDIQNVGGDPIEVLTVENNGSIDADGDGTADTTFSLMVECTEGCTGAEKPDEMRYVFFGTNVTVDEHKNAGPTSYGHTQVENSHSVAAAAYYNTPAFGGPDPPTVEPFSSEGGIPIYYDDDGNRLSTAKELDVPAITGPDGGNTTFFGVDSGQDSDSYPNFFGTSAAAPHMAGVAALMRSKDPTLTPSQLYTELENTAIDMNTSGYDRRTGHGFVQADQAISNVSSNSTRPAVPTGLTATPGASQITLNWESNTDLSDADPDEYDVHRSTTSGFTPNEENLLDVEPHTGSGEEYVDDGSEQLQAPSDGVTYYYKVRAVDKSAGKKSPTVEYGEAAATISPSIVTAAVSRSFGSASQAQDYRLVALPGQVGQKDFLIEDVVDGAAGTDWQAYLDNGSSTDFLVEYDGSSDFKFEAGNGFWLIATQDWTVDKDIQTVSLQNGAAEIPPGTQTLREGWNIISNPLDQDVDWTAVEAANDTDLQPLWAFNGSFVRASTFASAASGEAYYFYNSPQNPLSVLKIPYPGSAKSAASSETGSKESMLELSAKLKAGDGLSSSVQIGVAENEKTVVAPPGHFDAVSLRIAAQDSGAARANQFMAQRRRIDGNGEAFDLQLTTQTGGAVELTSTNLTAVRDQSVALLHPSAGATYDLTADESVTVETTDEGTDLKLLVGSQRYVDRKTEDLGPSTLTLTSYPNPIRDQGTIEYGLPEASTVRLTVYDLLGRRVSTLARGAKKAGRHTATLDASRFTSGVYFARLRAGGQTRTQKIVVVK